MSDRLQIANEMAMFDAKQRDFYQSLTDEERKKFSTYLMIRWGSTVRGDTDLQEYYVLSCNERLNKHFFDIGKHTELQWLCATAVSPGLGKFRHEWISQKKKDSAGNNKLVKFLQKLYPASKNDDIELMAAVMSKAEVKALAVAHGMTPEQIKKEL